MTRTVFPHVYRAIHRIAAEFARNGIPKLHTNLEDQYQYRSIDDVTHRLAPLLARHEVCALPQVLRRESEDRFGGDGDLLVNVRVLVAYDLVSARDASRHRIMVWGEALDPGDKGTAKALSAAYKAAMLQLFCIPVEGEDADAKGHRLKQAKPTAEPPQGWSAWSADIIELAGACERQDALDRLRARQSGLLNALKRERPDLYTAIGDAFGQRAESLTLPVSNPAGKKPVREEADA